jgi:CubicO group peptidase (beta-lactamase class C family)
VEEIQKEQIPAMTVAVAIDGRVVYSKGFGTADMESGAFSTATGSGND